jgi:hypothetical protein
MKFKKIELVEPCLWVETPELLEKMEKEAKAIEKIREEIWKETAPYQERAMMMIFADEEIPAIFDAQKLNEGIQRDNFKKIFPDEEPMRPRMAAATTEIKEPILISQAEEEGVLLEIYADDFFVYVKLSVKESEVKGKADVYYGKIGKENVILGEISEFAEIGRIIDLDRKEFIENFEAYIKLEVNFDEMACTK